MRLQLPVILLFCVVYFLSCIKHKDDNLPVNPPAPESYWYLGDRGFAADSLARVSIDSQSASCTYYSFDDHGALLIITIFGQVVPGMHLTLNNNCFVDFIDPSFNGRQQIFEYPDTGIHPVVLKHNDTSWFILEKTRVARWNIDALDIAHIDTLPCSVKLRLDKL